MDEVDEIHRDFLGHELNTLDAIERLQALGFEPKEAEQIVSEWADDADHDGQPDESQEWRDYDPHC